MATRKTAINKWYAAYAQEHMIIDEDNDGLFYSIISESEEDKSYTVRVDESSAIPVVKSCDCVGHKEHGYICKHMIISTMFIRRIYRSTLAKLEAKQEVVEIAMELPAELKGYRKTAVSADISTKGSLNGAQQSAALLMALPSRKKSA